MRSLILLLALASPAFAQTPVPISIPTKAEWVGPLEFRDFRGHSIIPTRVTLTIADGKVAGEWVGLTASRPSGQIDGTIDKRSRFVLTISMFGGAEVERPDGTQEIVATERCAGKGRFQGTVTTSGVLRWTSDRIVLDTPAKQMQDRHCENLTRLTWTLQLHGD